MEDDDTKILLLVGGVVLVVVILVKCFRAYDQFMDKWKNKESDK